MVKELALTFSLLEKIFSGNRLALSRLISKIENRSPDLMTLMAKVQEHCGHALCLGVTGPPGAGKSTLVDKIISHLRKKKQKVGVVAIDPSSPFSGGAVLGDRIRMQDHAGDEGVFIRSLGSRGSHGGLSRATREVVKLYDAFGMDHVIVETVGVGQTELDIMEIADTTIVVLTPESGDAIQTMKAGILEIADIFVVNKADRDGAHLMQMELKTMLEIGGKKSSLNNWEIPVLLVQASQDIGVPEVVDAIQKHQVFLKKENKGTKGKKEQNTLNEVKEIMMESLQTKVSDFADKNVEGVANPYLVAEKLLKKFLTHV